MIFIFRPEFTQQHQLAEPFSTHDFPKTPSSPSAVSTDGNMRVAWLCMFCSAAYQCLSSPTGSPKWHQARSRVRMQMWVSDCMPYYSISTDAFPHHIDRCPGCPTELPPGVTGLPKGHHIRICWPCVFSDRFGEIVTQQCPYKAMLSQLTEAQARVTR